MAKRYISSQLPSYMRSNTARARGDRVRAAVAVRDRSGNVLRNSRGGAIYRATTSGRGFNAQTGRGSLSMRTNTKLVGSLGH